MQTFYSQLETFNMKEEEYIATYFIIVDDIVISMQGLGETI